MSIKHFADRWRRGTFPGLDAWLKAAPRTSLFSGCAGSGPSLLAADLYESSDKSVLLLAESGKRCEILAEECASLVGRDCAAVFPSRDAIPYNLKSPFGPTVEARFRALAGLMAGGRGIIVAPSVVLLQKVLLPKKFFNSIIRIRVGDELPQEALAGWLAENGFRRETMVDDVGSFAVRGDIFDIYPFMTDAPLRIEFFGDTIESIRLVDVFSQKSRARLQEAEIYPMAEFRFSEEQVKAALARMHAHARDKGMDTAGIRGLEHSWKTLSDHEGIEWFLHWFDSPSATLLDYLPADTVVVWHDAYNPARRLDEHVENYARHLERVADTMRPLVSPPEKLLVARTDAVKRLHASPVVFVNTEDLEPRPEFAHRCSMQEQPSFPGSLAPLCSDLQARHDQGFECRVLCESLGHAERMTDVLAEPCPFVAVEIATLERGFIDRENKALYYAENRIFNRPHRRPPSKKVRSGVPIQSFDALSPGDFVVHIDHGIGRFVGIERVQTMQVSRDCMVVEYQDAAKLYVPVEDFHKVQKYIGKDASPPVLSKLGSASWENLKRRTRTALQEMARELIELYAKRQYLDGIRFSEDSVWQKEFEDTFLYEETADQHAAIRDVKKDMEDKKPMDRLICGDVGFGKTEVALRAAFKAVSDGYQAAVLAPTTILVAQHYETFRERMAPFPANVGMLSRFLSPTEQRDVVQKLKTGAVDIVIGTHRLLSKDVAFRNLGLLVVDEEQRFGVRHKEKLKQYRYKVDVLSMTATPIPRTLHLSLVGARDLSIINTPPANRLPIETRVMQYHDQILKDAVANELERGGQVYVVDNRIAGLYRLKERIEILVPRASVAVAHGQMDEKELEAIMKAFVAGTFDVLVSTVIIENGLDIPNVNTIVVNRADAMGLSQLYQLRGRVGRSSEQAYAFLCTPPFKEVHPVSLKRLRALEQYTDLGSGFQIAMRDLEIRGAGNILGTRQHGFIAAVGFELYCRLLKEAVNEIKGAPEAAAPEVKVDIPLEAYLPPEYVSDPTARVSVYQQLSSAPSRETTDEIEAGLLDRFGPLPPQVSALLLLMRIKILARALGASMARIDTEGVMVLGFEGEEQRVADSIKGILGGADRQFQVIYGKPVLLKAPLSADAPGAQAAEMLSVLEGLWRAAAAAADPA
ncbi:MAG: transcription-repair coupling factor [Chitinivibrionales bacterium]|nr:transcription-repair coupling factor [Chitinivibrionales bacterium]